MRWLILGACTFACLPVPAFDPASQDDSLALVRHFEPRDEPLGPAWEPGEPWIPLAGETVTLLGGTTVFRLRDAGYLEAALQLAHADKNVRVRNIGWPADTAYRQQRPMFFFTEEGDTRPGSVPDQRNRIVPGTMILQFGRMESLDGIESVSDFESAYDRLVFALSRFSQRIVIVAPHPFPDKGPAAELAAGRNEVLAHYTRRIQALADRRGAIFVPAGEWEPSDFAANGLHLSDAGQRRFAENVARALGFEARFDERTIAAVRRKNDLWDQYFRPTNWAFLFGDR